MKNNHVSLLVFSILLAIVASCLLLPSVFAEETLFDMDLWTSLGEYYVGEKFEEVYERKDMGTDELETEEIEEESVSESATDENTISISTDIDVTHIIFDLDLWTDATTEEGVSLSDIYAREDYRSKMYATILSYSSVSFDECNYVAIPVTGLNNTNSRYVYCAIGEDNDDANLMGSDKFYYDTESSFLYIEKAAFQEYYESENGIRIQMVSVTEDVTKLTKTIEFLSCFEESVEFPEELTENILNESAEINLYDLAFAETYVQLLPEDYAGLITSDNMLVFIGGELSDLWVYDNTTGKLSFMGDAFEINNIYVYVDGVAEDEEVETAECFDAGKYTSENKGEMDEDKSVGVTSASSLWRKAESLSSKMFKLKYAGESSLPAAGTQITQGLYAGLMTLRGYTRESDTSATLSIDQLSTKKTLSNVSFYSLMFTSASSASGQPAWAYQSAGQITLPTTGTGTDPKTNTSRQFLTYNQNLVLNTLKLEIFGKDETGKLISSATKLRSYEKSTTKDENGETVTVEYNKYFDIDLPTISAFTYGDSMYASYLSGKDGSTSYTAKSRPMTRERKAYIQIVKDIATFYSGEKSIDYKKVLTASTLATNIDTYINVALNPNKTSGSYNNDVTNDWTITNAYSHLTSKLVGVKSVDSVAITYMYGTMYNTDSDGNIVQSINSEGKKENKALDWDSSAKSSGTFFGGKIDGNYAPSFLCGCCEIDVPTSDIETYNKYWGEEGSKITTSNAPTLSAAITVLKVVKSTDGSNGYLYCCASSKYLDQISSSETQHSQSIISFFAIPYEIEDITMTFSKYSTTDTKTRLAGATYGIYSDSKCTKKITEVTSATSAVSFTISAEYEGQTIYLKELTAPTGYKVSTEAVKVTAQNNKAIKVQDEPQTGTITFQAYDSRTSWTAAETAGKSPDSVSKYFVKSTYTLAVRCGTNSSNNQLKWKILGTVTYNVGENGTSANNYIYTYNNGKITAESSPSQSGVISITNLPVTNSSGNESSSATYLILEGDWSSKTYINNESGSTWGKISEVLKTTPNSSRVPEGYILNYDGNDMLNTANGYKTNGETTWNKIDTTSKRNGQVEFSDDSMRVTFVPDNTSTSDIIAKVRHLETPQFATITSQVQDEDLGKSTKATINDDDGNSIVATTGAEYELVANGKISYIITDYDETSKKWTCSKKSYKEDEVIGTATSYAKNNKAYISSTTISPDSDDMQDENNKLILPLGSYSWQMKQASQGYVTDTDNKTTVTGTEWTLANSSKTTITGTTPVKETRQTVEIGIHSMIYNVDLTKTTAEAFAEEESYYAEPTSLKDESTSTSSNAKISDKGIQQTYITGAVTSIDYNESPTRADDNPNIKSIGNIDGTDTTTYASAYVFDTTISKTKDEEYFINSSDADTENYTYYFALYNASDIVPIGTNKIIDANTLLGYYKVDGSALLNSDSSKDNFNIDSFFGNGSITFGGKTYTCNSLGQDEKSLPNGKYIVRLLWTELTNGKSENEHVEIVNDPESDFETITSTGNAVLELYNSVTVLAGWKSDFDWDASENETISHSYYAYWRRNTDGTITDDGSGTGKKTQVAAPISQAPTAMYLSGETYYEEAKIALEEDSYDPKGMNLTETITQAYDESTVNTNEDKSEGKSAFSSTEVNYYDDTISSDGKTVLGWKKVEQYTGSATSSSTGSTSIYHFKESSQILLSSGNTFSDILPDSFNYALVDQTALTRDYIYYVDLAIEITESEYKNSTDNVISLNGKYYKIFSEKELSNTFSISTVTPNNATTATNGNGIQVDKNAVGAGIINAEWLDNVLNNEDEEYTIYAIAKKKSTEDGDWIYSKFVGALNIKIRDIFIFD